MADLLDELGDQPSAPKPVAAPAPTTFRAFNDVPAQRQAVYDQALAGVKARFPIENDTHRLELGAVGYDKDFNPTKADEKRALLSGGRLHRPLSGTVRLVDRATGSVLDQKSTILAHVPHLTSDGLVIHDGVRYGIRNQQRLRSGVFVRRQKNGGVEAHVNVKPGTGRGFRVNLDPESGMFKLGVEQSTTKLYPLMKALGVDDATLKQAWGDELFKKNWRETSGHDVSDLRKVVTKLGRKHEIGAPDHELAQTLHTILNRSQVDEDVNETTLGARGHTSPNHLALLAATKKILDVANDRHPGDNRDSQEFQSTHSAEDFIQERLAKDPSNAARKLLWSASKSGKLDKLASGLLTPSIHSLYRTGLAQAVEDVNPMETFDQRQGITRMGEGGIGSEQAVSRDARGVQPSYLGMIDPTRAPECYDDATEVMTVSGWKPWPAVNAGDLLACLVDGKVEFNKPERVTHAPYVGTMYGAKSRHIEYLVTPNHRMWVRPAESKTFRVELAPDVQGSRRMFMIGGFGAYQPAACVDVFTLPAVQALVKTQAAHGAPPVGAALNKPVTPIAIGDWLEFLGWYLAEGCVYHSEAKGCYTSHISQCPIANPANVERISALLHKLPFAFSFYKNSFNISGKQLSSYLSQFGKSDDKFIPSYVFEASVEARERFVEALLRGDGRRHHGGDIRTLCTASKQLALDYQRLQFGLGRSVAITFEPDVRQPQYLGCYACYTHTRTRRVVVKKSHRIAESQYYTVNYGGMVHCATVPGGLLYVRRESSDGFWCGNSSKIGLDMRATDAALKGSDGQTYVPLRNTRNGGMSPKSARQMAKMTIAFPGEMADRTKTKVRAMVNGNVRYVNRGAVDAELPSASHMFSRAANLVPLAQGVKSGRLLMGARMLTQALPLVGAEAPLVHSVNHDGASFYEDMGKHAGAVHAEKPGMVTSVTPDAITLRHPDGTTTDHALYNNYPLARKTLLHNTAVVQPGDAVQPGQLLAHSNFTDKNGVAAPGANFNVGYLSGKGATYEDAVVISEGAAKRLTSEHQYKHSLELGKHIHSMKTADYRALYGDKFKPEQFANLDEDGVIKVGARINPGDPVMVGMGKKAGRHLGALMKSPRSAFTDLSQTWDHPQAGVVTDVVRTKSGVKVAIKSHEPMTVGSKLSGLYGNKGVISRIVPDHEMPHDKDGKPLEVMMSPQGIITRVNPAALVSTLLGKIAAKRGEPYKIKSFDTPEGLTDFALNEAQKHGVSETEDLTDPATGRTLPKVFTGQQYLLKLHHTAEGKLGARDIGGYSTDDSPARGGPEGSKRVGLMDVASLISSGATEFLKDAKLVRGQRNDEYWRALKMGETPQAPRESFANTHFQHLLRAAGVNVKTKADGKQSLGFMTDRDIDELAHHEISRPETFDFKSMKPVPEGLFDLGKTGGAEGMRWTKLNLPAKIPNPLAEPAITGILGLTGKKFEAILSGKEQLDGKSGPEAIEAALTALNLPREIEQSQNAIREGSGASRDKAVKRYAFLKGLEKQSIKPQDLMISKMPVLPPKYRPITRGAKMDVVHDANYLYHDLMHAGANWHESKQELGDAGDQYLTMYHAAKAVAGLHDPVNQKSADRGVKGMLRYAIGVKDSPKYSRFQRKVLGNSVDTVGRGVITIDPELDMDQIGMPEDQAWTQFRPFVIRSLVRSGMPATEAVKAVRDRTAGAEKHLTDIMKTHPVVYNRAPSLHRYNYVGGFAKLNKGTSNISIPQMVTKGLGADFDGDAINVHVPVSEEARREVVNKLFPSKNLLHPNSFETHLEPTQEFLAGLFLASQRGKSSPKVFNTKAEALAAYHHGDIGVQDRVTILKP